MTTTTNLGVTHIVASQNQKEVAANAAFERLDAAVTETLTVDLTSGNATPTVAQVQQAVRIIADNVPTSGRTVTLPAVKRFLILEADAGNSDPVGFVRGSTTVSLASSERSLVYVDGTTNGLTVIVGTGGSGGGSGDMHSSANLSDVADADTSLANLGAGTGTGGGRAVFKSSDAAAVKTTLGLGTAADADTGDFAASGAATSSGLTMATARMLGRTTASTGAIEEITVGSGLSLSAGALTATGVASGAVTGSGLTMATARILGRTTASTGAIEEITVGTGLTLSGGTLTASGGGGGGGSFGRTDVPPASSSFSWVNQGGASVTDHTWGMTMRCVGAGSDNQRALVQSTISTPWRCRARMASVVPQTSYAGSGICLRDSAGGKITSFITQNNGSTAILVQNFNSSTSFSGTPYSGGAFNWNYYWLGIYDDGTNVYFQLSSDGENWITVYSRGRTSFLTANQVGVVLSCNFSASNEVMQTCFSFEVS